MRPSGCPRKPEAVSASDTDLSMKTTRKDTLLRAAFDMIRKAEEASYVRSPLEMTMFYDGTDCDGTCLADDIAAELGIDRQADPLTP